MTAQELKDKILALIPSNQTREISAADLREVLDDTVDFVIENAVAVTPVNFINIENGHTYVHGKGTTDLFYIFTSIDDDGNRIEDVTVQGKTTPDGDSVIINLPDNGDVENPTTFTGRMYIVDLLSMTTLGEQDIPNVVIVDNFSDLTGFIEKTFYIVKEDETNEDEQTTYLFANGSLNWLPTVPVTL